MAARLDEARVRELATRHLPLLSAPEALATLLAQQTGEPEADERSRQ
jgi:hypothetical protein